MLFVLVGYFNLDDCCEAAGSHLTEARDDVGRILTNELHCTFPKSGKSVCQTCHGPGIVPVVFGTAVEHIATEPFEGAF